MSMLYEAKGPNFLLQYPTVKEAIAAGRDASITHKVDVIIYRRETAEDGVIFFDKMVTLHPYPERDDVIS